MKKTTQRIIIAVSVIAVIGLFVFFLKDILIPYIKLEIANDLDGARDLLASKGILGFLTVVLVEALQMVVIFIPAEFIQISSGMSYPFYIAILLCDLGVCLGATIIYVLVRVFRFSNDAYKKNEEFIDRIEQQSAKKHRSTVLLMYFLFKKHRPLDVFSLHYADSSFRCDLLLWKRQKAALSPLYSDSCDRRHTLDHNLQPYGSGNKVLYR